MNNPALDPNAPSYPWDEDPEPTSEEKVEMWSELNCGIVYEQFNLSEIL